MSILNDSELSAYAFREAISRERRMQAKLKLYNRAIRDSELKNTFASMTAASRSRIDILQAVMKKLNLK